MTQAPGLDATIDQSSYFWDVPLGQQPALKLVYDTAPIGLAFLSPDCRYLLINQRLTEICGISVEDHLGRSVRDCVPALADSVEAIVRSIMQTGEPVIGVEVTGQRPDQNTDRSWITYWHPLRDGNGHIIGVNVAAEEITERKRNEQEIRRAKEAAETALKNLQEAQRSLIEAEKLAALGRLVTGVAHEINSPVGLSLTVASSLEHKRQAFAEHAASGELRRSQLNDFVNATADACTQLVANLNRAADLIQLFKQVAADGRSDRRMFDPGELTRQVLTSLRPGLQKHNLTLNIECEPELAMNSYPGYYGQVLSNLFVNSVMHAFPHGSEGTVDVKVRGVGDHEVEVLFCDDGCGMSFNVRRQAFNPFFTTRRDQGCAGLGLHIVHNVVTNRLGGRINLDSEPNAGTTVRLVLPRVAPGLAMDTTAPLAKST